MLTAVTYLLIGLLIVLILLISILFILLISPLRYEIHLSLKQLVLEFHFSLGNPAYRIQVGRKNNRLNWQFFLLGFKIQLNGEKNASQKVPPGNKSKAKTSFNSGVKHLWQRSGWKQPVWLLVKRLWMIIQPDQIHMKARIGFSEPHYTGWAMALAGIVQSLNDSYQIDLEGVWDESCMEGTLLLSGRLVPIRLLWELFKFILKPEIRAAYRSLRRQPNRTQQPKAA